MVRVESYLDDFFFYLFSLSKCKNVRLHELKSHLK